MHKNTKNTFRMIGISMLVTSMACYAIGFLVMSDFLNQEINFSIEAFACEACGTPSLLDVINALAAASPHVQAMLALFGTAVFTSITSSIFMQISRM